MHRHREVTGDDGTRGRRPSPAGLLLLELAAFTVASVAVLSAITGCILLVRSPVEIGTAYTTLILATSAAAGFLAAQRARRWALRRHDTTERA